MDLVAATPEGEAVNLVQSPTLIPTGLRIALPPGTVGLICPRSGLASKWSVGVANSPGIIDSDYRGEIKVSLYLLSPYASYGVKRGERIAQLLVLSHHSVLWDLVAPFTFDTLTTSRGSGGFGSTGV